jgi:hypothetical protein
MGREWVGKRGKIGNGIGCSGWEWMVLVVKVDDFGSKSGWFW